MTIDELIIEIEKHPSFVDWEIRSENMVDYSEPGPSAYVCLGLGVKWFSAKTAFQAIEKAWLDGKEESEIWNKRLDVLYENDTGLEPGKAEE